MDNNRGNTTMIKPYKWTEYSLPRLDLLCTQRTATFLDGKKKIMFSVHADTDEIAKQVIREGLIAFWRFRGAM